MTSATIAWTDDRVRQQSGNRNVSKQKLLWQTAVLDFRAAEIARYESGGRVTRPSNCVIADEFRCDHWKPEYRRRRSKTTIKKFLDRSPR